MQISLSILEEDVEQETCLSQEDDEKHLEGGWIGVNANLMIFLKQECMYDATGHSK